MALHLGELGEQCLNQEHLQMEGLENKPGTFQFRSDLLHPWATANQILPFSNELLWK